MNLPNLTDVLNKQLSDDYRQSYQAMNRASSIGFPCDRCLYFDRTETQKKKPNGRSLRAFHEGNLHEDDTLIRLRRAGVRLVQDQRPLLWAEHKLTGHIDGLIEHEGLYYPYEHKAFNGHVWDRIMRSMIYRDEGMLRLNLEAMLSGPGWMRKYPAQMMTYMLQLEEQEWGIWLAKNRNTGEFAQIMVPLDYEYAESILRKCDRINAAVDAGEPPEQIDYDSDVCDWCDWQIHPCQQSKQYSMLGGIITTDISEELEAWHEARTAASSYKKLDKVLKARLPTTDGEYDAQGWTIKVKVNKAGAVTRTITPPQEV
ncbi:MAG: hypothetical protein GY700_06490 [Propionibacteriaceae bacterium]|nr:hypothetical protein [Propionibacteriaceae bacterium]